MTTYVIVVTVATIVTVVTVVTVETVVTVVTEVTVVTVVTVVTKKTFFLQKKLLFLHLLLHFFLFKKKISPKNINCDVTQKLKL